MDLLTANDKVGEYPKSYYAATAQPLGRFDVAKGKLDCDICIIGGGFTGLSSALHLARKGFDVILLDAQRIGFGASGRNGGQVGTGQRLDQCQLEQQLGHKHARALWDISLQSVQCVKDLCQDELINCEFHPGIIHADHRKRFVPESLDYVKKLNEEYDYDLIEGLNRDEVQQLIGSKAYFGGTLDKGAGHIHPLKFAFGLARKAKAAGVKIFEQSKVVAVDETSPAIVKTNAATIKADKVILACNGYLGRLNKKTSSYVMPINNFITATEPMSAQKQSSLIRNHFAVADSKFVVNYFRFSDDGRLLFGGAESYGYRFPKDIAKTVRKPMLDIFPQLAETRIDYAWGGTLGITMNRMPHFAFLKDNILSLSGYSGHGVAMATLAGQIAAETFSGETERFEALSNIPMQRFPGGNMLRTPLLVLAMLWYSTRDKF